MFDKMSLLISAAWRTLLNELKSVFIISKKHAIIKCINILFKMDKVLLDRLRKDFPEIRFRSGVKFLFRPPRTVVLGADEAHSELLLLHEVGHALCGHRTFTTDVRRLKMEREAWTKAKSLCAKYGIVYDDEVVEHELDSYREWLDKKSRCPRCGLTRFQTPDGQYHCPRCES